MSENKEITRIIEEKEVNMFTGKCRIEEAVYYLDAEYVNGERINIPDIWLFKGEDPGLQRTGTAAARENGNVDALYRTQDEQEFAVKGRLTIHKGSGKKVIYLSDKDTIVGGDEESIKFVESLEKDPLMHPERSKKLDPLCKVYGVMSCNEDGESRQDVIRKVISRYGKNGSWMGPGRLVRTLNKYNGKTEIVTMEFAPDKLGVIYDKFGENIEIRHADKGWLKIKAAVQISPTFWGWIYQLKDKIKIVSPEGIKPPFDIKEFYND